MDTPVIATLPSIRRVSSRLWVAVALAAAIVAVLLVVLLRSGGGEGPLVTHAAGFGLAQPAAIGQAISVSGPLVVENTSDRPLVLDRAVMVGLPRSMYRGAYVLPWPPKQDPFTAATTYRVPSDGRPLPGATIAPHAWAWIVIGLTAERGRHRWTRVDIVYRDGGTTYRRHAGIAGAVCASALQYKTPCDIPSAR